MKQPETIKIVNEKSESGFCLINKSDFDPKAQKEFSIKRTYKTKAKLNHGD